MTLASMDMNGRAAKTAQIEVRPAPLEVVVRPRDGRLIVSLRGELDLADVALAREAIAEAAGSGEPIVIDLRRLEFIDLAGAALLRSLLTADGPAAPVLWRSRHGQVERLLAFAGVIPS